MKILLYLITIVWLPCTAALAQLQQFPASVDQSFEFGSELQHNAITEKTALLNEQPLARQQTGQQHFPKAAALTNNCLHKESNRWYFGNNAGIDFNTEPPTPLTDGVMTTYEGCATVCDANGDLLFYTNGITIWNRQHEVMQNGDNLNGHASATQSAIIVPKPGATGIYYIFTVDAVENRLANGARYSIVDISQNGGLGLVTTKNILLANNASERIIAARHCNGKDFWIISHQRNNDVFEAYLLTGTGVSTSPVRSSVGSSHTGGEWTAAGSMKVSPNGDWLAIAIRNDRTPTSVELFTFNNETGLLRLSTSFPIADDLAMSVEFSPDNSKLYFSAGRYATTGKVYQADLSSRNPLQIRDSRIMIASTNSQWWGVLQLAPNGKIYLAKWMSSSLGVINNPNARGIACNFQESGFDLAGKSSYLGLPNLMAYTLVASAPSLIGPQNICLSPTLHTFRLASLGTTCESGVTYQWYVSSGATILSDHKTYINVRFNRAGTDTVIVHATSDCGTQSDTIIVKVIEQLPLDLGKDILLCENTTVTLDAGPGFSRYIWSNNMGGQTITVSSPGKYWVRVQNEEGCTAIDTITISMADFPPVTLGPDTSLCKLPLLVLDAGPGFKSYLWQDGSRGQRLTASQPGTYIVRAIDSCGVASMDTLIISIKGGLPPVRLGNDTSFCEQTTLLLDAGPGYTSYTWQDGSHEQTFTASQPGTYIVQTTDSCGQVTADTLVISPTATMPPVALGPDISTCAAITVVLDAGAGYKSYTWQDDSHGQTFTASQSGSYIVQTVDFCGNISADTLLIEIIEAMPSVRLGPDTSVCAGITVILDAGPGYTSYTWQDNSHEQTFTASQPGRYIVQTVDLCGTISADTLFIEEIESMPPVALGSDTSVCKGEHVILDAGPGYTSYTWQDGSHEQTFTASAPGTYIVQTVDLCDNISTDTIVVTIYTPVVRASSDTTICYGASVRLSAEGAVSYRWFPATGLDNPLSATPIASPLQTTMYTVIGTTAEGCTSTSTLTVTVFDTGKLSISLPDTTAAPGSVLDLPLHLTVESSRLPLYIDNLSLAIQFQATIFKIHDVEPGTYTITPGQKETETVYIDLHDILLTEEQTTLATIRGTVYLGSTAKTSLTMHSVILNGCAVASAENGTLAPDSVCSLFIRHVRTLGETSTLLEVSPNPVRDAAELTVTTTEQGEHLLSLYNLQGQLLWRNSFLHSGERGTHTLPITIEQLGTGLYEVVLTTPTRVRTQNISIIR